MRDQTKTVKIFSRCTPEDAQAIDAACDKLGLTRPSDGKPVRAKWLDRAIETQLSIDVGRMELTSARIHRPVPQHPFTVDPRARGELVDYVEPSAPKTAHVGQPVAPATGGTGIFEL